MTVAQSVVLMVDMTAERKVAKMAEKLGEMMVGMMELTMVVEKGISMAAWKVELTEQRKVA